MRYIKIALFFTFLVVSGCQYPPTNGTHGRYFQVIEQPSGDVIVQITTASPRKCLAELKAVGKREFAVGLSLVCSPHNASSILRYKGIVYDAATGEDIVLEAQSVLTCQFYFDNLVESHKRYSKKSDCT